MSELVRSVRNLGFVWETADPFLFCVHHDDAYPAGDSDFGPKASLAGRNIGSDFEGIDGWRMYHGERVPGFPVHPHRGFETVTLVRRGLADHADSLGASGRFGGGDVQWMTAGRGVQHSEMFPLLNSAGGNHLELFQIWLNLPAADKFVEPHYKMLWREQIPTVTATDPRGSVTEITLVAGALGDVKPPSPTPNSWAARPASDVAIWTLRMAPDAAWTLPPAKPGTNRTLYSFAGGAVTVGGRSIRPKQAASLAPELPAPLRAGPQGAELVLLQGQPIGEPVAKHGPFVMNTTDELRQAYADYQRTRFGGWPWERPDPVHGSGNERFARHADGRVERPA